jgi:dTMP kinase
MLTYSFSSNLISSLTKSKSGFLIAFEGIDGSGKTTQAKLLASALEGIGVNVVLLKEPTSSPFGMKIRSFSKENRPSPYEELRLFLLDREFDVKNNILPALETGKVVIMDRYIVSSLCHQGALGLNVEDILKENISFPWPHLNLVLDIDLSSSWNRIMERTSLKPLELFEEKIYLMEVKNILDSLSLPSLIRIKAEKSKKNLLADIFMLVQNEMVKVAI